MIVCFVGDSHAPKTLAAAARYNGFYTDVLERADLVFVSQDTPTDANGNRDLEPIRKLVTETVERSMAPVFLTSQVPPGFTRSLNLPIFHMAETLRIKDADARAQRPEQFIVGVADPAYGKLPEVFNLFVKQHRGNWLHDSPPVLLMSYEEAEFAKIAINMTLAAQVDNTNRLAKAAEKVGARWKEIERVLGNDHRIGPFSYLTPGRWQDSSHLLRDHVTLEAILAR